MPNAEYVDLDTLYGQANMISIHVPLLKETKHMINESSIAKMQENVIIVKVWSIQTNGSSGISIMSQQQVTLILLVIKNIK